MIEIHLQLQLHLLTEFGVENFAHCRNLVLYFYVDAIRLPAQCNLGLYLIPT